jgi:hypothetical protein
MYCETTAVVHSPSSDDVYGPTSQRRLVALALVHACRDEDGCGNVACMATTFTSLRTDEVDANSECLCDLYTFISYMYPVECP